jgi:sigma-B regulation protein RsbU (phosphoserine phosphatase)
MPTSEVDSLRRSVQIYKGLVEVSGLINSITDYDELLRAVLNVARRVMRAEAASLFFCEENEDCMELAISSSADGEYVAPKIRVPRGRGIAGWVVEHGQSLLIPDAYADDRFYKEADKQTGFRTRSILCAPLKQDSKIIGVLQVLNPTDKESFDEHDLEGFTAYSDLTATAIEKLRTLERSRTQERMERDLSIAAEIQHELLSRALPSKLPGALFAAHATPASNVGGDFYNFFVRKGEDIYFSIGDVSGKGIPASLLMAQTLSAMQFVFAAATSPNEALSTLNSTLHDQIVRGMFITTLIGRLTPAEQRLELASAGHCKPILIHGNGKAEEIAVEPALPMGILPSVNYRQLTLDLHKGDWLVCYTDGLSESRDEQNGQFFGDTIVERLSAASYFNPQQIVDRLVDLEATHRGDGGRLDDLTIIAGGIA